MTRTYSQTASFILKSLQGFINYFAVNCFGSYMITSTIFVNCSFNLEAALQTNGVIERDSKEVIIKQLDNAPKRKDDEKNTNDPNYRINTTNADLVEFKGEKVIIL